MNMDISHAALIVSAASLCVSLYIARKQQIGLSAVASAHLDSNQTIGYKIGIYVVNNGWDPITIKDILIKTYDNREFRHEPRNKSGDPIKLVQSEFCELFFTESNSEILEIAKSTIKSAMIVDSYERTWNIKEFPGIINKIHHKITLSKMGRSASR
jgi:hypothetical protein